MPMEGWSDWEGRALRMLPKRRGRTESPWAYRLPRAFAAHPPSSHPLLLLKALEPGVPNSLDRLEGHLLQRVNLPLAGLCSALEKGVMVNYPLVDGITFDDVLLVPQASDVLPAQADVSSRLFASLHLRIPFLSAAMDTVTEAEMAIAMAIEGGVGIVHKNLAIEGQVAEVRRVKRVAPGEVEGAERATRDASGRLRVGAAIGVGSEALERAEALLEAGADFLCIDTAHGHSARVVRTLKEVRRCFPEARVMVGNIATGEAAGDLIDAGADALKVGIGPGSICTTRVVAGVGVPQITAIDNVARVSRPAGVPLIADGGIRVSGDVAKAIGAGADVVMIGSLLAGTDEAPGECIEEGGRRFKTYRGMGSVEAMKRGASERYFQRFDPEEEGAEAKLVPEGVAGCVPYRGPVASVLFRLVGGLRAAMGYCGCSDISSLQSRARFVRITSAGLRESHVHDVTIDRHVPRRRGES